MAITNTIGTVRVAWSTGPTAAARGQDDIRRQRDQFRRVFARVFGIACGPAIIDPHIASIGPAQLLPAPAGTPRRGPVLSGSSAAALMSTPIRRIRSGCWRARRERPRRRAAEQLR